MRIQDFFRPVVGPTSLIVIRFHNVAGLPLLMRAVWSAANQEDVDVSVLVLCQNFSDDDLALVKREVQVACDVSLHSVEVQNALFGEPGDHRTSLLNLGIEHALINKFSYLSFLDYDDALLPFAIKCLINSAQVSGMKFAYADLYAEEVLYSDGHTFTLKLVDRFGISKKLRSDLVFGNFLPIHSYLMATSLFEDGLRYDEGLHVLEDYELLLRIAQKEPFSPLARNIKIGFYRFYRSKEVFNTTGNIFVNGGERDPAWRAAHGEICRRFKNLTLSNSVAECQLEIAHLG